jgi:hypothetical protein|eukprot:m.210430 g.210430  ORF g.210430 m.210430 type:complete len:118 (+) comp25489_c1_seq26:1655-2008(+)
MIRALDDFHVVIIHALFWTHVGTVDAGLHVVQTLRGHIVPVVAHTFVWCRPLNSHHSRYFTEEMPCGVLPLLELAAKVGYTAHHIEAVEAQVRCRPVCAVLVGWYRGSLRFLQRLHS